METPVRLMGCVVVAIMTVLGMRVLARHSIQRLICPSSSASCFTDLDGDFLAKMPCPRARARVMGS